MFKKKYLIKTRLAEWWGRNIFLAIFLFILLFFSLARPQQISAYPSYIDWRTIAILAALIFITTGFKKSGFFHNFSLSLAVRFKQERTLSFFMVFIAAFLAMFLTNDVALLIIVPLTISLRSAFSPKKYLRLAALEVIAANVGSAFTPIGNPQNIFLWRQWGISFFGFLRAMLPLEITLLFLLAFFVFFLFSPQEIKKEILPPRCPGNKKLFIFSLLLLLGFLAASNCGFPFFALIFVFGVYGLLSPSLFWEVDWGLLVLFLFMFIDLHLVANLPVVKNFFQTLNLAQPRPLFLAGVFASQAISNVPAALLLAKFSHYWKIIAYGVNVGGNGLIIASLANIIALRLVDDKGFLKAFHKYSLLFLALSVALVSSWLFLFF